MDTWLRGKQAATDKIDRRLRVTVKQNGGKYGELS